MYEGGTIGESILRKLFKKFKSIDFNIYDTPESEALVNSISDVFIPKYRILLSAIFVRSAGIVIGNREIMSIYQNEANKEEGGSRRNTLGIKSNFHPKNI